MFAAFSPFKLTAFFVFLISAVYTHFRGKVRYKPLRQLTDHSTFMAPINAFMYLFSGVPNTQFMDRKEFPELDVFKENWKVIRDEALPLIQNGDIKASSKHDDVGFNSFFKRGWKRFYLKWYGTEIPSAQKLCPKTLELIAKVPNLNAAMFTYLPAGSKLGKHRDPYAGSLRYHLGLITPNSDDCRIYVDGIVYSWRDGEDVVFDETFMHWAENNTDVDRLLFFCDVERPMKYGWAQMVNRFVGRYGVASATAQNVDTDPIGMINRLFKYFYMLNTSTRGLKKDKPIIYYTLKILLFASLAYLLFVY